MELHDHALVMRRIPFRESSLVLHMLTRGHGALAVMARGVRQGRGGERAALAGFHTVMLHARGREGGEFVHLRAAELAQPRFQLAERPLAAAGAQLLKEAVYRFTPPGEVDPTVFPFVEQVLDLLQEAPDTLAVMALALGRWVSLLGYGWQTGQCGRCGGGEGLDGFSVRLGQAVCAPCAPCIPRAVPGAALVAMMGDLPWPPQPLPLSRQAWFMLYRLGCATLTWHGGGKRLAGDAPFRHWLATHAALDSPLSA